MPNPDHESFASDLPDEYLRAIGAVAVAFSWLEYVFEGAIHGLAEIHGNRGQAITTHMTMPLRQSVFLSLVKVKTEDKSVIKEAEAIASEIKQVATKRAKVVHGLWWPALDGEDHPSTGNMQARAGLKVSFDQKSVDKIHFIEKEIDALTLRLLRFTLSIEGDDGPLLRGMTEAIRDQSGEK